MRRQNCFFLCASRVKVSRITVGRQAWTWHTLFLVIKWVPDKRGPIRSCALGFGGPRGRTPVCFMRNFKRSGGRANTCFPPWPLPHHGRWQLVTTPPPPRSSLVFFATKSFSRARGEGGAVDAQGVGHSRRPEMPTTAVVPQAGTVAPRCCTAR